MRQYCKMICYHGSRRSRSWMDPRFSFHFAHAFFQTRNLIFISVAQIPWAHKQYLQNDTLPWELEKQIRFHMAAVQSQLEQLYYGFALGVALNRTIILPEVGFHFSVT